MESEVPAHTCPDCGRCADPATAPSPQAAPCHYPRVACRRPQPTSTTTAGTERIKVGSRKAAPSAAATREARERQRREEEAAALDVELTLTKSKAKSTAAATTDAAPPARAPAHPCSLPRGDSAGRTAEATVEKNGNKDGEDGDEDDGYYKINDRPEPTLEERMEAIRKAHEERLEEKHMALRLRQGVARRPKALLRTRYGQFKSIDSVPANARRPSEQEAADGGQPLLLGAAPHHDGSNPDEAEPNPRQWSMGDDREKNGDALSAAPPLVHPSAQLDIDLDDDDYDDDDDGFGREMAEEEYNEASHVPYRPEEID